jgi:hypothetical protein
MGAYKADFMGWDFNGPLAKGYPEITAAYRMLFRSLWKARPVRFARLCFKAQPECWGLVKDDKLDELAYVFMKDVLAGEDYDFVVNYMEKHPMEDTHINRFLRNRKGIGKNFDARINEDAGDVVKELRMGGTENFVYSASFVPIIEGSLTRNGLREYFSDIIANEIRKDGDGRIEDYAHYEDGSIKPGAFAVNPLDKSETFHKSLRRMNLPLTGEKTGYVEDSEPGRKILTRPMVEFPFVAPNASKELKERCRDENPDVVILNSMREIPEYLSHERKVFSYPAQ